MPLLFRKKKYTCEGKSEELIRNDLYEACREGKTEWLEVILSQPGYDANALTEDEKLQQGLSALHLAARYNQLECLKLLLNHKIDVNIEDRFGFRPIHDAALYGYTDCVRLLLSHGASTGGANGKEVEHVTPLFYAVQQNHKDCVNLLKSNSLETDDLIWDIASKRGCTSLTSLTAKENVTSKSLTNWLKNSALTGHANYLEKLKRTAGRKFGSREALTTIIAAAQHGKSDYIKKLIKQGVDVNIKNIEGNTALHYAARYGHEDTIKMLVDSGADMNMRNKETFTPFHVALRQGCLEGISTLLDYGQNVNQKAGEMEETPLHMCLTLGVETDLLKAILEKQPDLTLRNKDGKLPTEIQCDYEDLTNLILEYARN